MRAAASLVGMAWVLGRAGAAGSGSVVRAGPSVSRRGSTTVRTSAGGTVRGPRRSDMLTPRAPWNRDQQGRDAESLDVEPIVEVIVELRAHERELHRQRQRDQKPDAREQRALG